MEEQAILADPKAARKLDAEREKQEKSKKPSQPPKSMKEQIEDLKKRAEKQALLR